MPIEDKSRPTSHLGIPRRISPRHAAGTNKQTISVFVVSTLVAGFLAFAPAQEEPAEASSISNQSRTYSFDTSGELAGQFDAFGTDNGRVTQSANLGISGSGSVFVDDAADVDTFRTYRAKDGYSLGPIGSKYTFETFFQSFGYNGYSGMGFTAQAQGMDLTTTAALAVRPNDALGIMVHGGGWHFHNGDSSNTDGTWMGSPLAGEIASPAPCDNAVNRNRTEANTGVTLDRVSCASVDGWYKMALDIERTAELTFQMTVKLWDANSAGVLRPTLPEADRATPLAQRTRTLTLPSNHPFITSPEIFSYFSFSGKRFQSFDGFAVTVSGGATVVQSGFPVVLTTAAAASGSTIEVSGNVSRVSGTVQERGFVYSTSPNPDTEDTKRVDSVATTGTFQLATPPVPEGTYYVRAFATDSSNQTSFGVEKTVTIAAAGNSSAPIGSGPTPAALTPPTPPLPEEVDISTTTAAALRVDIGFTGPETSKPASYNVQVSPGGGTCRVNSAKGFCDIPGVRKGVEYSISVTAVNALGSSKPSVVYNRVLLGSSGWLTYSKGASLENFAGNSPKVTRQIRTKARAFARNNQQVEYVTCVGFAAGNVATERQFELALTRAKRVCDQLKKVNPELETSVFSRVPGSAFSGANRRVLVTGYSPIS